MQTSSEDSPHIRTVIYIAGYGRSGSTILDILFGSLPNVVSLGEVANLWQLYFGDEVRCSCGRTYRDCPFWSQVIDYFEPEADSTAFDGYQRLSRRVQDWKRFLALLLQPVSHPDMHSYARLMSRFFDAVAQSSGTTVVVDSSKSSYPHAWRALALQRLCGLDVRVIHLVRNGMGVMASRLTGGNRKLALGLDGREPLAAYRGLVGWLISNLCVILTRLFLPGGRYYFLSYEELITQPEQSITRLGKYLELEVTPILEGIEQGQGFAVGHLVAGNRLAQKSEVRLNRSLQPPVGLAWHHRLAYRLCGWPLRIYAALAKSR
jgi:hypothetical protein